MEHTNEHVSAAPIVVGVDGSDNSARAFELALDLAQRRGVALRVVTVYTEPVYDYLADSVPGPAEQNAQQILTTLLDTAKDIDVEISSAAVAGGASEVLIDESKNASLVVLGKRGRSRFAGRFLGSVSTSVASHAHCPSLIVPGRANDDKLPEVEFAGLSEDDGDITTGIIASDGTPASADFRDSVVVAIDLDTQPVEHDLMVAQPVDLALLGAQYAEARGLRLDLVTAEPFSGSLWMTVSPVYQAELPHLRTSLADRLANLAGEVQEQTSAPVQWRYFDAAPADVLAQASMSASMIVMGTRGRGGFAGLLLGSVSQAVLNRAVCPVLVVPTSLQE